MFRISDSFSPLPEFGHEIQQTVMPIVTKIDDYILPVGTGFMINRDGLMITAYHVLEYAHSHKVRKLNASGEYYGYYELYAFYITNRENQDNKNYYIGGLFPIDGLWCPNGTDIAFCWLRECYYNEQKLIFKHVQLSPGLPKLKQKVCGFGYYNSKARIKDISENGIVTVEYDHDTAFTTGTITKVFPLQRPEGITKFPCFEIDARFEAGMSGGPLFNEKGSVCGVICCSGIPENPDAFVSYGTLLWTVMGAEIDARFDTDGDIEPRKVTMYELIERGNILTDESIKDIICVKNPDGTRTVSVKKEIGNE